MKEFTCLISKSISKFSTINGIKITTLFVFILLSFFSFDLQAQADTPCEGANRWQGGSKWNADGTIDDRPNSGEPNGIIRCGSSAETQSQILPFNNAVYNSSAFLIDVEGGGCVNPSTGSIVAPDNPTNGQPIVWLNFDVRPYSGSFEVQINDNSGDNIGWALYVSTQNDDFTTYSNAAGDDLSGDCSNLTFVSCGVESSSTWNTIPVGNVDFLEATNFYLAIWDQDADGNLSVNNFKARFGCGDGDIPICALVVGEETVSCVDSGTYQVVVPITGTNAQFTATDANALTISEDVCLSNIGVDEEGVFGSFTLTYNIGTPYNISISAVKPSTNGCADPFNPTQCVGGVSGSSPNLPTVQISDQTICETTTSVDLTLLEPEGKTGGTWSNSEGDITDATDVDPNDGPFTYTITDNISCEGSDDVAYTFYDLPEAGTGGSDRFCIDSDLSSVDLFALIVGGDTGGSWTDVSDGS
ncbi:hypothetical protein, partial [Gillisia hiemivivida]